MRNGQYKVIAHPCGHCVECSRKYQNDWMLRLEDEASQWRTIMFATLTYDDKHVPYIELSGKKFEDYRFFFMKRISQLSYKDRGRYQKDTTGRYDYLFPQKIKEVDKLMVPYADISDIQKFMKRLRTNFKRTEDRDFLCKYFICSEYGPNTLRPHFHMILFCNEHELLVEKYIKQVYGLGKVHDVHKIMSFKDRGVIDAMRYVSKYTCKPAEFENPYVVSGLISKPKRLSSKFLGDHKRREIREKCAEYIAKNDADGYTKEFLEGYLHIPEILRDGFRYGTPKYWRDAIFPQTTVYNTRIKDGKEYVTKATVKDTEHRLSVAIEELLLEKRLSLCVDQYNQVRDQHPEMSDSEVIRTCTIQDLQQMDERYTKAISSYYKHYSKQADKVDEGSSFSGSSAGYFSEDEAELRDVLRYNSDGNVVYIYDVDITEEEKEKFNEEMESFNDETFYNGYDHFSNEFNGYDVWSFHESSCANECR